MTQDLVLARLLANNAQWAEDVEKSELTFFDESAKGQAPKVLWIGCSDSRVPESVITASKPGDIFVHRNIANQFHLHDDSANSVINYAVHHLGADHVIVVGHTNCGGAAGCHKAARAESYPEPATPLARWLDPLVRLARDTEGDVNDLVDANVRAQVQNVVKCDTIQEAWAEGKDVKVHGWVYDLETGRLRDLGITVTRK